MFRFKAVMALLVFVLGSVPAWADSAGKITVSGEGVVYAVPDMAVINMGASSEADTARAAMDQTSETTAAILDRLTEAGIAARDVQTSDLSLSPIWTDRSASGDRPRIDGYQASNRVTVRVRDLDSLGPVLDAVLTEGANQFDGLQFTLSDPEPLMNEARRKAVADARARAELFAEAAGVQLGALLSLSEAGARAPRPEMMSMARASDGAVPVARGETELRAGVTLVYEIAAE
ncbi:SIMPL domain-containing protein [Marivita sp.]|uniref:SIMPL domain-containing protein n=1 Tax=Marivita sp. TaxID=2003365 RepID=UPI0025C01843|nr:SIMPL domain-containing protein [Marivita sp.]